MIPHTKISKPLDKHKILWEDHHLHTQNIPWKKRPLHSILALTKKTVLPALVAILTPLNLLADPPQKTQPQTQPSSLATKPLSHIDTNAYEKGPYTLRITQQGNFGEANYLYRFQINKKNKEKINKSSKSTIQGWRIHPEQTQYNKQTQTLWAIYHQALDGLDPRTIHLLKIKGETLEEAIASYSPLNPEESLKILSLPKGWDKKTVANLLQDYLPSNEPVKPLKVPINLEEPEIEKNTQ